MDLKLKKETNITFSPLIIGTMRLGAWGANLSTDALERYIDACLDAGFKDFDLADIYGDYTEEKRFGEVLKRRKDLKNKIQLTSKCGIKLVSPNRVDHKIKSYDCSANHIIKSVDQSLVDLGVDEIDLLLIHRPDYLLDPAEVAHTIDGLKQSGKIKYFGVSNFSTSQFELLNKYTPLVTNQIAISLLETSAFDNGQLDQCMLQSIKPTAWSPFGGGAIFNLASTSQLSIVLEKMCDTYDASKDQILLAFLLRHPSGIIPIVGSSKIERIISAKAALELKLSREDWYCLLEAARGKAVE